MINFLHSEFSFVTFIHQQLINNLLQLEVEICGVWFFRLLLRSCVSEIDSCSWYDSWLQKNYWLLFPDPVPIENIPSWSSYYPPVEKRQFLPELTPVLHILHTSDSIFIDCF